VRQQVTQLAFAQAERRDDLQGLAQERQRALRPRDDEVGAQHELPQGVLWQRLALHQHPRGSAAQVPHVQREAVRALRLQLQVLPWLTAQLGFVVRGRGGPEHGIGQMVEAQLGDRVLLAERDEEAVGAGLGDLEVPVERDALGAGGPQRVPGGILQLGVGVPGQRRARRCAGPVSRRVERRLHAAMSRGREARQQGRRVPGRQEPGVRHQALHERRITAGLRGEGLDDELPDQASLEVGQEGARKPLALVAHVLLLLGLGVGRRGRREQQRVVVGREEARGRLHGRRLL
jgi:hypothetical protein